MKRSNYHISSPAPKIAFIHSGQAYLPEIGAYSDYFRKKGYSVEVFSRADPDSLRPFAIEWHFMGTDRTDRVSGRLKIHEYTSRSLPPFYRLKDYLKRTINSTPDLRIFLSDYVQSAFAFRDNIPSFHRDMGITDYFFSTPDTTITPDVDLVYCGTLHPIRKPKIWIEALLSRLPGCKLLLIGEVPAPLRNWLANRQSVITYGRAEPRAIPALLRRARFGIDIRPYRAPFYYQTSSKALEYSAVGLPVILSDDPWTRQFETESGGQFFKVKTDFSNLSWEALQCFPFRIPDLHNRSWDQVIGNSGIPDFIDNYFNRSRSR